MTHSLIFWALLFASPTPLETAATCYEDLDYSCAENAISEALGGDLSRTDRLRAWRYEALLSIAWRDLERARRAVRAIYAIEPDYQPQGIPPNLASIFESERPPPPPEPEWHMDSRYVVQFPTDTQRDARWWSVGQGLKLGFHLVRPEGQYFNARFGYLHHPVNDLELGVNALHLWGGELGTGVWRTWGRFRLSTGVYFGLRWVSTDVNPVYEEILDTSETDDFFGSALAGEVDLSYRVWNAWGLSFSVAPELLIRNYQEQPHFSYFVPLLVGVRYGG